jgi:hypothetical protein
MGFLSGLSNLFGGHGMQPDPSTMMSDGGGFAAAQPVAPPKASFLDTLIHGGPQITGGRVDGEVDGQGLLQAPTMTQGPGLMERLRTADPTTGLSMADKIYMIGSAARDEGPDPMKYAQQRRMEVQTTQDRARKNQAFAAAYDPDTGKFNPAKYVAALGGANVDPSDIAQLTNAFKHKRQIVQDSHGIYSADPESDDGDLQTLQAYPEKPAPEPTVDHVIGGILQKYQAGQPLSPQEKELYHRWTNGTPPKPRVGGGGHGGAGGGAVVPRPTGRVF